MRTSLTTAVVIAGITLVTAACTSETTGPSESSAESSSVTMTPLGDDELAARLPGEGQMPGGWGAIDGEGEGDNEQSTYPKVCGDLLISGREGEDLGATQVGSARRTFIPPNLEGAATSVRVTSYPSEVPASVFEAMGDALQQCSEYQQTNKNGTTTYLVESATGPSYGDRSFRFRSRVKGADRVFERVVFAKDNLLVQVLEMHPGGDAVRTGGLEAAASATEKNLTDGPPETTQSEGP